MADTLQNNWLGLVTFFFFMNYVILSFYANRIYSKICNSDKWVWPSRNETRRQFIERMKYDSNPEVISLLRQYFWITNTMNFILFDLVLLYALVIFFSR